MQHPSLVENPKTTLLSILIMGIQHYFMWSQTVSRLPSIPHRGTWISSVGDSSLIPDLSALGSLLKCDSQVKKEPLTPSLTH